MSNDILYKAVYEEEVKEEVVSNNLLLPPPPLTIPNVEIKPLLNIRGSLQKHPFAPRIPGLKDEDFFVAVYGSLKRGFGNHKRLSQTKIEFEGFIKGGFDMYSLSSYPALCVNPDSDFGIDVEVYPLDEQLLKSLDSLEGYPNFYTRDLVWVRPYDSPNDLYSCWVYYIVNKGSMNARKKVTEVNDKGKITWSKQW
jgi:gamma-glutamylcyclotransferase (GGCT)/AIG2-like uncharacterized protein YtfP